MRVLDRYIVREFIKTFAFGTIALLLVSAVVVVFEQMDNIVEHKPGISVVLTFLLAKTPQDLFMIAPISMLLTTLLVTGAFARNSEVTAMLASGVSIYRIMVPILAIGFVMSLLMFGLNEFIVPTANRVAEKNKRRIKGQPDKETLPKIQIWYRDPQQKRIYYINALIPGHREIQGLTVFTLNDRFLPVKRLDALKAVYTIPPSQTEKEQEKSIPWKTKIWELFRSGNGNEQTPQERGTWTLYHGIERSLGTSGKRTTSSFQERHDYHIPQNFEDFRQEMTDPEDMNYRELKEFIQTLTGSGYADVSKYVVDLRAKLSYPFVSLVMVIIGFPFALKSPRSGAAMGVGISVFIGLTYWITLQLGISLGHALILPPLLAAWISNIIFAATGFYLILSTRT